MCLRGWCSLQREEPFGQLQEVVERTASHWLVLPAWLWMSIGCVRCYDNVLLRGYREWSGKGRMKGLALLQSLGVKRMDCVVLRCCLESSALAGFRGVWVAICILRPCTIGRLGGLRCWQLLTNYPSEGGTRWTVPTWFPSLLPNPWYGLT